MKTKERKRKLEVLEVVRDLLISLLSEGRTEEAIETAMAALSQLHTENTELVLELAKLRREQVGRRSEKLDPAQLMILLELCGEDGGIDTAEEEDLEEIESDTAEVDPPVGRPRRRRPPKELPREVISHTLPPEERLCESCGSEMTHMGDDVSEVLELVPAQFKVQEYRRAKYACSRCKDGVKTAPGPAKLIEKGLPGPGLLAHIVQSKFEDHAPLNRLSRIYARHGVDIPVSTMCDWVAAVAEEVTPIVDRIWERVEASHVVQTDASGLRVLDRDDPNGIRKGTMWCHVGDGKEVVFRYSQTGHGEEGPWKYLAGRTGYIQADASNIFDRLFNGKKAMATEVGCWAHARRKLFVLKESDPRVGYPLKLIAKMFRVEKRADAHGLSDEQRATLRRQRSRPILDRLKEWLVRMAASEPPASALHKACAYSLNHWIALTRFLEDGRLEPDNNGCERQIRSLALGRRNYLFAGSDAGAERAATLYSLLRTCALHGVDTRAYVVDVLTKLAEGWPYHRLDELLPGTWKAPEPTVPAQPDEMPQPELVS